VAGAGTGTRELNKLRSIEKRLHGVEEPPSPLVRKAETLR
jgi:hypothetical protein